MTGKDIEMGLPEFPGDDEKGHDEEPAIQQGKMPEPSKSEKSRQSVVSSDDIKEIIERIRNERFDHLNARKQVEKWWSRIEGLSDTIKGELYYASQGRKEINDILNLPSIKGHAWSTSDDPWYETHTHHQQIEANLEAAYTYRGYQFDIIFELLKKTVTVLFNIQDSSEEAIRARTIRENMNAYLNRYDGIVDRQSKNMELIQNSQMEAMKMMIQEISKAQAEQTRMLMETMKQQPTTRHQAAVQFVQQRQKKADPYNQPADDDDRKKDDSGLTRLRREVLEYLKNHPGSSPDDIVSAGITTKPTACVALKWLRDNNYISEDNTATGK